ncbi:hypothetical protein M3936_11155 [Sutcliffiella horikoshii]|uniref:hypothetical protein n=1 Tax=Sutcliffiella horikoshii TaxID=79883 RepID=UPI00203DFAC2|nr:hypothetical protein [Sutcliffiella horikoshii]MCM3618141.1 hypothetical protein [Sutcliffiella horikoshii]
MKMQAFSACDVSLSQPSLSCGGIATFLRPRNGVRRLKVAPRKAQPFVEINSGMKQITKTMYFFSGLGMHLGVFHVFLFSFIYILAEGPHLLFFHFFRYNERKYFLETCGVPFVQNFYH